MEDVTTDVQEAHEAAKDAELEADKAKERMDNWVADNIFSKLEQQGLEDELRKINADYSEISTECSKYDIEMGDYVTTYDIIVPQLQDIISELNANETTAIPSDFEKNLDEYYTQRTAILTTISNKADEVAQKYADNAATNAVDGLVLATENILKDSMLFSTSSNPILRQLTIPIKANTEYVFSIENTMTDGGYTNVLLLDQTLSYELANLRCEPNKKSSVVFTCIEEQREVYLYAEPIQATLFGVKIAEGNRYSPWEGTAEEQQALITLTNAMKGSTDIIGGLVLTNLIQLKDEGGNVVAGITGLTTEDNAGEGDVFAWAGGPLEKAISGTTPVLLKRHGKGSKIGCLVVEDNDKVRVKTNNGSVLIDADGGITMYDDNEIEKIVIFPENLTIDDINEYHTINILTNDITESNISMPRPIDYYKVISSFIVSASNNLLKINPNKKTWEVEFNFSANSEMNNSSYPGAYSIDTYLELYNETTGEITNIETAKFNGSYSSTTTIGNKITLTNNEEIKLTNIPTGTYIFRFVFKCKDIAYIPPGAILPSGTPYIYNAKMAISFKKSDGNYLKAEYSKQNNVTYIGKNGLLVNNNYWAYMFASINGEILDFRLRGLPSSPINTGQLYVTEDGILKVKQ